eukprot:5620-Pelagomonas_calceolata.AAC.1
MHSRILLLLLQCPPCGGLTFFLFACCRRCWCWCCWCCWQCGGCGSGSPVRYGPQIQGAGRLAFQQGLPRGQHLVREGDHLGRTHGAK